jgi:hypothetical protein
MRQARIYTLIIASVLAVVTSCKDDSLELVPEWETGVHGLAEVTSSNTDFMYNTPAAPIDVSLQWISIDSKLKVNKIELFVIFNENYVDKDGNPAVAAHGGTTGRLFKTYEGGSVPGNRDPLDFSITQAELYTLYQDATFDYGDGPVSVFANPDAPQRDAAHRFYWEDALSVRWQYTTDDGRVFKKWGVSVCTEFPGANCSVDFGVVCASEISNPQGTWTFDMQDTYGDGWQGGYISVIVDGTEAEQINIPSQYDGNPPMSALVEQWTYPAGGTTLEFEWFPDAYGVEVVFKIISPSGNTIVDVADPPEGPLKMNLCLE